MTKTIPDLQRPSFDEYGIVTTFSLEVTDRLIAVQRQLRDLLGDTIWLTPERALHITLMEIICDVDYGDFDRKKSFDSWYAQYNQPVIEIMREAQSFTITFDRLEVSPRAIIARASDTGQFNDLRNQLLGEITLPAGTKQPPDITHCTLARFNTAIAVEVVREQIQSIKISCNQPITQFSLLKDLGPPTFDPQTITCYPLRPEKT